MPTIHTDVFCPADEIDRLPDRQTHRQTYK